MPNTFDATGLTVETLPQIIDDLTTGMQGIYGTDINVASNSPDGQLINIFAQAVADLLQLLVQINASFDPDRAIGVLLDERCAINNIFRQGGTYTIQPIDITVSTTVTLQGLDANFNSINGTGYTVQDNAGNQFILQDSVTLTAGTTSKNFRAQQIGAVETTVDTITTPVTIVLGVTSVNNSSAALQVGQNEETDAQLRVRRQQSVSINSSGYLNGLYAFVGNITGVTDVRLYENVTSSTDANGIPAHGIWLIVEGGADTDIANAIYIKKSYGANMKGSEVVNIITPSNQNFLAKFDRPLPENLYIKFDIQATTTVINFDEVAIKQYIVDNLTYQISQYASQAEVSVVAQAAITNTGGIGVPVDIELSIDGVYYDDYFVPSTLQHQWVLDVSRININIAS